MMVYGDMYHAYTLQRELIQFILPVPVGFYSQSDTTQSPGKTETSAEGLPCLDCLDRLGGSRPP